MATRKHPGEGGHQGGGSILVAWSLALQVKASSSRDMEVAEGGSDLWSTHCATLEHVQSLPVITLASATMSNEVMVAGSEADVAREAGE